jgi:WD40 repeat protein
MPNSIRLGGAVEHMTFVSVNGGLLLAAARSQGVELRSVPDNVVLRAPTSRVVAHSVAALPVDDANDELVVGAADGHIRLYSPSSGALLAEQQIGEGAVQDLVIVALPGDRLVVAGVHEDGVALWEPATGTVHQLPESAGAGPARPFKICAYHALGSQWLACAYSDDSLGVWDLGNLSAGPVARHQRVHRGQMWSLIAVDEPASGYVVATGSADGTVRLWAPDSAGGLRLGRTLVETATVRRLRFVRDAEVPLIVTASASGAVSLWRFDGAVDRPLREVARHFGEVWSLACAGTRDGGIVIASGDMHGIVEMTPLRTDLINDRNVTDLFSAQGTTWVTTTGATANGPYVACAGVDQLVHVLDPDGVQEPLSLSAHVSTVRSLLGAGNALDPHLISGGADRRVFDWDPVTGALRGELPMNHQGEVWALASFRLRGQQYVASGSADGSVRMCALTENARSAVLIADCGAVNAVVAVPHGDDALLTVASNRGVRVISAQNPATVTIISTHQVAAACAIFDGRRHQVVTARPEGDVCVVEIIDPMACVIASTFRYTHTNSQVSALAAARIGQDVLLFGGCDDGQVLVWQLDGSPVGKPVRCGTSTIRSLDVVEINSLLTTGSSVTRPALLAADDDGRLRMWPIATGSLLRSGGSIGAGVQPASILLQDQPTEEDTLARDGLIDTIHSVLTSSSTKPPVVIGIHAPWGQGKSSVLRQLRARLDPAGAHAAPVGPGEPATVETTHELVPRAAAGRFGRLRAGWTGGVVRTRLTRAWAWRQIGRPADEVQGLPYEMRPTAAAQAAGKSAITVWFNPWMYEKPDQVWAGLTREILTSITDRLPVPQRERLWFDLNLRRTDPASIRRRILASYIPRTLIGMLVGLLVAAIVVMAVVAVGVAAWNSEDLGALVGSGTVLAITAAWIIGNLILTSFKQVRGWIAPGVLIRPAAEGVAASDSGDRDWKAARDPLEASQRGYLYMLQHDVREIVELASAHCAVIILVDDLDRCSPPIVADTVEAVNLFLNKAFGDCFFVIALDPATVAAQLETVYDSLRRRAHDDPSTFGHLQHTGWRFMEKILDLPIRLPRVRDQAMAAYLDGLLDSTSGVERPSGAAGAGGPGREPGQARRGARIPVQRDGSQDDAPPEAMAATAEGSLAPGVGDRPAANPLNGGAGLGSTADPPRLVPDPRAQAEAAIRLADELERLQPVRLALRTAVLNLPQRNPRQTKAFINLWRFYMVLDYRTGHLSSSISAVERHSIEMARFVELMVRWPWLLDALGAHRGEDSSAVRIMLAELLDACADDQRWKETAVAAGLRPDDATIRGLRELLRRSGTDSEVFASIAVRYL